MAAPQTWRQTQTESRIENWNLKFWKEYLIISQIKAIIKKIVEWAFLSEAVLENLHLSAPKKSGFVDKT